MMNRMATDPLRLPAAHERLGQLYEAKGNTTKAVEHYQAFIDLWKNADPELQPRVAGARRRLGDADAHPEGAMSAIDHLNAALADRYAIERELGAGGMATVYLRTRSETRSARRGPRSRPKAARSL